jgi:hypothetical protein
MELDAAKSTGNLRRHLPMAHWIVGHFALAGMGQMACCDHCKNRVFDRTAYGSELELWRARRCARWP